MGRVSESDFLRALEIGRPPNIRQLFPNSRALIVSGKAIIRAMLAKGQAMAIAANGRNIFVIIGTLLAAQRANAALFIEIALSESGYCAVNFWNLARIVDALCNQLGITVPVAIHADHYTIKSAQDVARSKTTIPTMLEAGMTSFAIDPSHLPNAENLLANIEICPLIIPGWAGLEVEVGEIKGKEGLSTPEEALFLIQGLNAHGIYPDMIAANNGTTHGVEESDAGIQISLTEEIHATLKLYGVTGAQHGTSGNSFERLMRIARETRTVKANVATALQMLSWGMKVNPFGNAERDKDGNFIKVREQGVEEDLWAEMAAHAKEKGWKGGNLKKLSLPFDNRLQAQPKAVRARMAGAVAGFVFTLITEVFNSQDTAPLAVEAILNAGSYDLGSAAGQIEDPVEWTEKKIREKAALLEPGKDQEGGNHDD